MNSNIIPDWDTFRNIPTFKAFSDATIYTDGVLDYYWSDANFYVYLNTVYINYIQLASVDAITQIGYLLVAHLLTLDSDSFNTNTSSGSNSAIGSGNAGIVSSLSSAGGLSVSLVPPPASNQTDYFFNQTPFGQRILFILKRMVVGGFVVNGGDKRYYGR